MKKLQLFCFTILLLLCFSLPVLGAPEIQSDCAVVIDMDTGQILYEKNGYTINYFDNMAKLLNVSTALNNGDMDQKLEVTDNSLLETDRDALAGKLGLASGDRITLKDALYAEILGNADDAARVVAGNLGNAEGEEKIGDSDDVKNYIAMMKSEAKYLCASQMMVSNVMGLNSSDQICTAMDLAYLMYNGFRETDFRRILTAKSYDVKIYGTKTVYTETKTTTTESSTKTNTENTNTEKSSEETSSTSGSSDTKTTASTVESLKNTVTLQSQHKMVNGAIAQDGVKGGFVTETESNGFHSVTYARKTVDSGQDSSVQRKIAVVIMKSPGEDQMYQDIATLLDYGFQDWKKLTIKASKLNRYLPPDVDSLKIMFSEDFECLIPADKGKGDLLASAAIDENGHRSGTVTFTLKDAAHPLGKAVFYENTNVKTMQPWIKTLLYIGIGLLLLVLCWLLYNKFLQPFMVSLKKQRAMAKRKKKTKGSGSKRERGYRTAQKEKELRQKEKDYFDPQDTPHRKSRRNRKGTHKKRR